jgi:hypothetical protein
MSERPYHWLDELAAELHTKLHALAASGAEVLRGKVPIGTTRLTRTEKLVQYLSMSPEQRTLLATNDPERAYTMEGELIRQMGPAGAALLPYLAPYTQSPSGYPFGQGGQGDEFA